MGGEPRWANPAEAAPPYNRYTGRRWPTSCGRTALLHHCEGRKPIFHAAVANRPRRVWDRQAVVGIIDLVYAQAPDDEPVPWEGHTAAAEAVLDGRLPFGTPHAALRLLHTSPGNGSAHHWEAAHDLLPGRAADPHRGTYGTNGAGRPPERRQKAFSRGPLATAQGLRH